MNQDAMARCTVNAADVLAGASERIRTHRQSDLKITVRDAAGKPVPGAQVKIEQTRHAFLFGNLVFSLPKLDSAEKTQRYTELYCNLYNYATLPFYWRSFEPERGSPRTAALREVATWCRQHALEVKGHPLTWHESMAPWLNDMQLDDALIVQEQRIQREVGGFAGLIDRWDVFNEATVVHWFKNWITQWCARDGVNQIIEQAMRWARAANPNAFLLVNDFNVWDDRYDKAMRYLAPLGLIDAIGIQSHMHERTWPLGFVWEVCERFGVFNLPLHWTELTVLSGPAKPPKTDWHAVRTDWNSTPEGEAQQAEYLAQLFTLLFSHPRVEAITKWGFMDKTWMGAPGGIIREDLSPKPAYTALRRLIREEWWTKAALVTAADGVATVRAFHGEHELHVNVGAGEVSKPVTVIAGRDNAVEVRLA